MSELTVERVKELLDYDPGTGVFTWKVTGKGRPGIGQIAGRRTKGDYVHIRVEGRMYKAHRLAWFLTTGVWPPEQIDHVNRDRSDNRICNLRLASRSSNQANRPLLRSNTSGRKGVYWNRTAKSWQAYITVQGKRKHLGNFRELEQASLAYDSAALKFFGAFALTNAELAV